MQAKFIRHGYVGKMDGCMSDLSVTIRVTKSLKVSVFLLRQHSVYEIINLLWGWV